MFLIETSNSYDNNQNVHIINRNEKYVKKIWN